MATRWRSPPERCAGNFVEQVSYMKRLCNLRHFRRDVLRVRPARHQRKRQVLARAHVRKQREILEHHRQIPIGGRKLRNVAAANANFAGIGRLKPQQ